VKVSGVYRGSSAGVEAVRLYLQATVEIAAAAAMPANCPAAVHDAEGVSVGPASSMAQTSQAVSVEAVPPGLQVKRCAADTPYFVLYRIVPPRWHLLGTIYTTMQQRDVL
jgi:hypothetical protein